MKQRQFKFIKGSVTVGNPADIYFYTDVDGWSVDEFIYEFNWLMEYGVSRINVHINSCGGSVVDGMSVFSRILDCKIPTACYNDGLAASMGSIIWAAGQEVYMKDYALLMIHNPFSDDGNGKTYDQITDAFKQQLKIIYQKRFGLSDEEIEAIMNGEGDNDGTFFTAAQAVEKGFVSAEHIIETPATVRNKVSAAIKDGYDIPKLKAVMNELSEFKPKNIVNTDIHINNSKMNENEITVFAALLGISGKEASVESVSAQINALKAKADKYDTLKAAFDKKNAELSEVQTKLTGSEASVKNLTTDLDNAKAELKKYQDAEEAAQNARINSLVEDAIGASKIDKADKETWVTMAKNNFDLTKKTLDSIPAREDISGKIANNKSEEAHDGLKDEEQKIQDKVNEVIGKEFKFHKFGE